jgi:hypothetical protein
MARTIRVKESRNQIQLSPDLQPPAAFISRNVPYLWFYVFVTSHVLADVANAPPAPDRTPSPPRRFVSMSLAPPIPPQGPVLQASQGATAFALTSANYGPHARALPQYI